MKQDRLDRPTGQSQLILATLCGAIALAVIEYLTPKAEREMKERFALEKEAIQLLDLVVMEWKTDPLSIQCFDLRIVDRAKAVLNRLEELTPEWERP